MKAKRTDSNQQAIVRTDLKKFTYLIGIDPGVRTGLAVWNKPHRSLVTVCSTSIIIAMERVRSEHELDKIFVRVEDARKRKWFGKTSREVLQGAGSIKRDCQIWEEFFELHNIPHEFVAPKNNITKLDAKLFANYTGYKGQTNEHSRDAAMLVYQL